MSPPEHETLFIDPFDRAAVARAQQEAAQVTQEETLARTGREAALVVISFVATLEAAHFTREEALYLTAHVWRV